ncbi:hypothetical protein Ndes2526B_g06425 [Nannochloris sp. 'desiccata']
MASSPTNENTTATPNLADLSFTTTTSSSTDRQDQIPVLPLEVLRQTLDQLGNVVDLANVAMVCRDWRELINSCDACWEKAFFRDYNKYNAEDYVKLPTWRQKYIACTLDLTYLELRDAGRRVNELEETVMYLEERVLVEEHNERPTGRFQKAVDDHIKLLHKAYKKVEAFRAKRDSLQAATKYKSRYT